ncbi:Ran-binding protein M homolog [Linum perenne]
MQVKNGGSNTQASIGYTLKGKNGKLVGIVSKKIDGPLFPTISVFGSDEEVKVNFGHKPFAYDTELRYPEESWKSLMKKSESMLRKSIEEKEEEVASLKEARSAYAESWEKLLNEKDRLMEKTESLLKKSLEEKEKEVISMKAVLRALSEKL